MRTKFLIYICSIFLSLVFSINAFAEHELQDNQLDGKIVASLLVLNKNEIAAADEALRKGQDPKIKEYAKMMKVEHSKNLLETQKIAQSQKIVPQKSEVLENLSESGKKELAELKKLNGKEFDKVYIEMMIKDHTNALNLIDNMLKDVKNPELKSHLETTKNHIAEHLEQAQIVQNNLA